MSLVYRSSLEMVSVPVSATPTATSASLRFEFWLATRSTSNASRSSVSGAEVNRAQSGGTA